MMAREDETTLAEDLAAAFEAVEKESEASVSEPEAPEAAPQEQTETPEDDIADVSRETEAETGENLTGQGEPVEKTGESEHVEPEKAANATKEAEKSVEPPPAGWKPLAREVWKDIPEVARSEIRRRETEIATTMQQLTDVRKFADNFAQTIYPYRENIRREGATPLSAVQSLMQVAATLQTASAPGKAAQIAELVHRYGVDIRELDEALASGVGREAPIVQQRVAEAVKPFQEALARQQEEAQQRQRSQASAIQQELEAFKNDPKNEFFPDVRLEMADIMDAAARRGHPMTFSEVYEKVCTLNPDVGAILKMRAETAEARKRAEAAKQKQRAAKSLPSASSGDQRRRAAEPSNPHDDLRADLEAAMNMARR